MAANSSASVESTLLSSRPAAVAGVAMMTQSTRIPQLFRPRCWGDIDIRHLSPTRSIRLTVVFNFALPGGNRAAIASTKPVRPSRGATNMLYRAPASSGSPVAIGLAALAIGPPGADQASMPPLHFRKAWHRRRQAQFFRIGGVDASHQRLHQPLVGFAAQPPPRERGHAFVGLVAPRWHKSFANQPQLAAQAQNRRPNDRPRAAAGSLAKSRPERASTSRATQPLPRDGPLRWESTDRQTRFAGTGRSPKARW